jgi:hypothetical protein
MTEGLYHGLLDALQPCNDELSAPSAPFATREARSSADHSTVAYLFDTRVMPALQDRIERDPVEAMVMLRDMLEPFEAVPQNIPRIALLRQRLAMGIVECALCARLPLLVRTFREPAQALKEPRYARVLLGVGSDELAALRGSPLLAEAVAGAVRECGLPENPQWVEAVVRLLAPTVEHSPPDEHGVSNCNSNVVALQGTYRRR